MEQEFKQELHKNISVFNERVDSLTKEKQQAVDKLEHELNECKAVIDSLRQDILNTETELRCTHANFEQANSAHLQAQEVNTSLVEQTKSQSTTIQSLQERLAAKEKLLEELQKKVENLQQSLTDKDVY